jgi:hypothetical protein
MGLCPVATFGVLFTPAGNRGKQGEFDGMSRTISAALLMVAALGVSACDNTGVRRSLGLDVRGPDEFRVVSRAPLDLPPEFGLRPPTPGAARPNEPTMREQAKQTVFGGAPAARQVAGRTAGESVLLRQAGAVEIDGTIRETVNRESAQLAGADRNFTDRLIFWRDAPPPGTPVDAVAEQQRLRENAALGKPATAGETPIIQRKRRGILEGIF